MNLLVMRKSTSEVDFSAEFTGLVVTDKRASPSARGSLTGQAETGIRMPTRQTAAIRRSREPVCVKCCLNNELRPRPPTRRLSGTLVA